MPLLSLGQQMVASAASADGAFSLGAAGVAGGGHALRTMSPEPELFEAAAMLAVEKDLMDMLVRELKEELAARDEPVSGNKAWLRRRLHAAIVHVHLQEGAGASF